MYRIAVRKGFFNLAGNDMIGDLDPFFCVDTGDDITVAKLEADCGGAAPEVRCTCCTTCCRDSSFGSSCQTNSTRACDSYGRHLENFFKHPIRCRCNESTQVISCDYADASCQTCNENSTVCGVSYDFGYTFGSSILPDFNTAIGGDFPEHARSDLGLWHASFQYQMGRTDHIYFQYDNFNQHCDVLVNGQICKGCEIVVCRDGYYGLGIDCTNVVAGDAGVLDSCNPKEGGVFDVFVWMETDSWNGCPFVTEP